MTSTSLRLIESTYIKDDTREFLSSDSEISAIFCLYVKADGKEAKREV